MCPHASSGPPESNVSIYTAVLRYMCERDSNIECIEFSQQSYIPKEAEAGVQSTTHVEEAL